jgi:hypothetical protein
MNSTGSDRANAFRSVAKSGQVPFSALVGDSSCLAAGHLSRGAVKNRLDCPDRITEGTVTRGAETRIRLAGSKGRGERGE